MYRKQSICLATPSQRVFQFKKSKTQYQICMNFLVNFPLDGAAASMNLIMKFKINESFKCVENLTKFCYLFEMFLSA